MARTLVLNATYEPLGVVGDRRAVVLVLSDKAECVQASGEWFRSERLDIEVPSVVRLRRFVRVPYHRRTALSRRAVFARDGGRCQYCEREAETIDHVVPRSRGGEHAWDNVVAACRPCNAHKSDRLLENTSMKLRTRPKMPEGSAWLTVRLSEVPRDWTPYLDPVPDFPAAS
jgi:5-methylcytosine-specific restriction endonuclease McrA